MKRAIQMTTVLAMGLGLVVAGITPAALAFEQTYQVRANLPVATGFSCNFAKVTDLDPDPLVTDLDFNYNSGLSSFDFGDLVDGFAGSPGVFNRDFYIICDVSPEGGVMGLYDVDLEYLNPVSPNNAVEAIGQKAILSVSAVDPDANNPNPETPLSKTRLDMAPDASTTAAQLLIGGVSHFARIAVGLSFGDDYSGGVGGTECDYAPIPAGNVPQDCPHPFTSGDAPGEYTADLKITVTPS